MSLPALVWTLEFIVLDADRPTEEVFALLQGTTAGWAVVRRSTGGPMFYALTLDELWRWPALRAARERGEDFARRTWAEVLELREQDCSTAIVDRQALPPIDRSWRANATAPSIGRYVEIGPDGRPSAIGHLAAVRGGLARRVPVSSPPAAPPGVAFEVAAEAPAAAPVAEPVLEDEGTTPVRFPAIEAEGTWSEGRFIALTIDLRPTPQAQTHGGPVDFGEQPSDWSQLTLTVLVSCPGLDLDGDGRGSVVVRRNATSVPATITGTVRAHTKVGDAVAVSASFFLGTRFCGSALRSFQVGGDAAGVPAATSAGLATSGTVVPQPGAAQPDVTVRISTAGTDALDWLVETARFDGLPPKLRERSTFERGVSSEVAELFKTFASLQPGQHVGPLHGFGTRLWNLAPRMFRDVYWALWDHYKRPLTIQFITDEPDLPWELMRPARDDESEVHEPLALVHPVARWIERYDGYMRNLLPPGKVLTIAPRYASVSLRLPRAQTESETLVQRFGATTVPGTRAAVLALLKTAPPAAPVAVLHFAGHGEFAAMAATESRIVLEDGAITASEIRLPEVKLGKACRTLVFFNACEVGAAGGIFGEVGGWAEAFLSRQFGGFIAPLWSVEDEDAGVVAGELLDGILRRHRPIGNVLTELRARHGAVSPTFYSYLYYGDVTAHLAE